MDSQLVVLHFDDEEGADAALATLRTLDAEGFLHIEDVAVLTRADDGSVQLRAPGRQAGGRAVVGVVLGTIVGGLVGLPVVGAAVGGGAAARRTLRQAEALDDLLLTVGRRMTSGTAAIALLVTEMSDPQTVSERLERHRTALLSAEVPAPLRELLDPAGSDLRE